MDQIPSTSSFHQIQPINIKYLAKVEINDGINVGQRKLFLKQINNQTNKHQTDKTTNQDTNEKEYMMASKCGVEELVSQVEQKMDQIPSITTLL